MLACINSQEAGYFFFPKEKGCTVFLLDKSKTHNTLGLHDFA